MWLAAVFLVSGFAALVYQLVWQRILFTIYGIDIASVTMVVTAFMLGLGLGSLAGGWLSSRFPRHLLPLFALVEVGIGLFGLASLPLFRWVADLTLGAGALETGLVSFGLVLVPTLLMGSTLPLLVAWATRRSGNVGRSVGVLYGINTLGSAVACFVTAGFLLGALGLWKTTLLAALLNLGGAAVVWWRHRAEPAALPGAAS